MILDGSNHVFEVRINDVETMDTPKYGTGSVLLCGHIS